MGRYLSHMPTQVDTKIKTSVVLSMNGEWRGKLLSSQHLSLSFVLFLLIPPPWMMHKKWIERQQKLVQSLLLPTPWMIWHAWCMCYICSHPGQLKKLTANFNWKTTKSDIIKELHSTISISTHNISYKLVKLPKSFIIRPILK